MKIANRTVLAIAVATLGGCTGQVALLKNDKGELAKCEVTQGEAMWSGIVFGI